MKKLISIGVALAVLALVVLPVGAAAQCAYDPDGTGPLTAIEPATYAKIPFAILETGLYLLGNILTTLAPVMGLPTWLGDLVNTIAPWTGGPLSWTVDMLGWGLNIVAVILNAIAPVLGLPTWLSTVVNTIVCQVFAPFSCNVTGAVFAPVC